MTIVISAVNLRKGGTLKILNSCLEDLSGFARAGKCRLIALVHKKELAFYEGVEYIELPWSVCSWVHRLWCEYVTMYGISKKLGDIDLWLSLHDTTPRVKARHQAVYCHNSYPFFRWQWHHLWLNYRIVCFALFTKWIYRINIHRNDFIIVQSEWFRDEFVRMFDIDAKKIVVFPPNDNFNAIEGLTLNSQLSTLNSKFTFIYPAYPDVHKNFECLCEAARMLESEVGTDKFEVILTADRNANKYCRWIDWKWGHVKSLYFAGFMDRKKLDEYYAQSDCLVFPSQVETWGLPISEFASMGRPMLLADLPYAHETAMGSQLTAFFNPNNQKDLKEKMKQVMTGNFSGLHPIPFQSHRLPMVNDWTELINILC